MNMQNFENKVLSSVHSSEARTNILDITCKLDLQNSNEGKRQRYLSRFFFHNASKSSLKTTDEQEADLATDVTSAEDDRKFVSKFCKSEENIGEKGKETHAVARRDKTQEQREVLTIEHELATSLKDVGYQVWSGALLLCDYLLHHQDDLIGSTILDLGSGPGLTSIVAAMFANTVMCTDYSSEIVKLAESNWQRNHGLLPTVGSPTVLFKVLDWNKDYFSEKDSGCPSDRYILSKDDLDLLKNVSVILAAEVVYDDDITDAFFRTVYHLLAISPAKSVFIAIERRIVYSTDTHEVCSPAYEHFKENLMDLISVDEGTVRFQAKQINTDFPRCFEYDRVKELELWQISSYFPL